MTFFKILVFCIFIEGLVTYVKEFVPEQYTKSIGKILPVIIGVGVTVYYKVDMLVLFKLTEVSNIGNYIITGVILSRGSNYLFDIINLILSKTTQLKEVFNNQEVAMSYEDIGSPFVYVDDDQLTNNLEGYSELGENLYTNPDSPEVEEDNDNIS